MIPTGTGNGSVGSGSAGIGGDSACGTGEGGGDRGRGLDGASVPVSRSGKTALPLIPFAANASDSTSDDMPPAEVKVKLTASPSMSPNTRMGNVALPAYGPNGAVVGVSRIPRTSLPTYAVSVPDDCTTLLSVTSAVTDIELENSSRLNTNGDAGGMGGDVTGEGHDGGAGGGGIGAGDGCGG